jgi:hypothetical protein
MRGQKRPVKERARAVGIAVATGSIAEAARQTGIAETTIHQWLHSPEYEELRTRNKEEVSAEWWAGVQKAFRRTVELLDNTEDPVKSATAGAIMFDKMALSRGEATGRTETRTWTDGLDPDKQRALRDWALGKLDELADVPDGAAEGTGVREPTTG